MTTSRRRPMSPLASILAGQMPRAQPSRVTPARPPGSTILPLRIELAGSDPLIWRRVLVPDTVTLGTVHNVIQAVFIWDNSHMHGFRTVGQGRRWLGGEDDDSGEDEDDILLVDVIGERTKSIDYVYDFGDSWEHRVKVERRRKADPGLSLPVCVEGANAAPPDDCGGVWGYSERVAALRDPKHPDHAEVRGWFGKKWDATAFDIDAANRRLKARVGSGATAAAAS